MTYTFYEDPGHGWLAVPKAELVSLGIDERITSCSYMDRDTAYLEEDCDFATFVAAKLGKNPKDWRDAYSKMTKEEFHEFWENNVTENDRATLWGAPEIFIRKLPSYSPTYWYIDGKRVTA